MNPYLKYAPGGPVDPKKKVNVDGKEMEIGSDEYRKLYDTNSIMPVDSEGLPTMYGPEATSTAKAPDWLKVKRGEMTESMRRSKAAMSELGNEFLEQSGIAGAYKFGKEPINNILGAGSYVNDILFNPYVAMGKMAAGHKDSEKFWNTVDAAGLLAGGIGIAKQSIGAGKNVVKQAGKKVDIIDEIYFGKGDYRNVEKAGRDKHDVRLKKHGLKSFLTSDEKDMLKKYGEGNPENYKNVIGEDILGKIHTKDKPFPKKESTKGDFMKSFDGEDQPKIDIPENTIPKESIKPKIELQNLHTKAFDIPEDNIKKPKKIVNPFKNEFSTPYERTSTSRAADKWLEDWFDHEETKKRFFNVGGTKEEWETAKNSFENPLRSNYVWGNNQPGGVYMHGLKQASIPLDASVDFGVHENFHKTGFFLPNVKNNLKSGFKNLWNDFTDAVREVPYESYPELFRLRYKLGLKPGDIVDMDMLESGLSQIYDGYGIPYKVKDKNKLLEIINKAPMVAGAAATSSALGLPSGEQQSYRTGGQNPYLPTYSKGGNTKTSEEKVNCTNCGWSWKLSEGGDKPYMCHECNHDNSQDYKETTKKQQYKKGGKTDLPCPPYCDNPLEPYERYEEEEKKRDPYNPNNKRIITEGKKTKPINKTLGWNVLEYFNPSGVSSWPDVADAWSDKRFTYNDIVEPLSAIPVLGKIPKTVKGILKGLNIFDTVDDIYNDNLRPILKKIPDMDPLKNFPPKNYKSDDYKSGGDAGHSTVEIERSERVYTPDGNLIMETPANAPTHEEGGVKVTLPGGSLVFPKKYFKSLDAASGLPAFKKITNTMLDNAEKAYLRGEAYSSGGKRK